MSRVVVIGGGAAGCFAAMGAAECGHEVTLIEKNEKLGKRFILPEKEDVILPMTVIWKNLCLM